VVKLLIVPIIDKNLNLYKPKDLDKIDKIYLMTNHYICKNIITIYSNTKINPSLWPILKSTPNTKKNFQVKTPKQSQSPLKKNPPIFTPSLHPSTIPNHLKNFTVHQKQHLIQNTIKLLIKNQINLNLTRVKKIINFISLNNSHNLNLSIPEINHLHNLIN
jgi:hypothetical protein